MSELLRFICEANLDAFSRHSLEDRAKAAHDIQVSELAAGLEGFKCQLRRSMFTYVSRSTVASAAEERRPYIGDPVYLTKRLLVGPHAFL